MARVLPALKKGCRTFQTHIFKPQVLIPGYSTIKSLNMTFSLKKKGVEVEIFSNLVEIFNPNLMIQNRFRRLGLPLGVEKSVVEMSYNPKQVLGLTHFL